MKSNPFEFDIKRLNFLINLSSYKPLYILLRIVFLSGLSILLLEVASSIAGEKIPKQGFKFQGYLFIAIVFNAISEINIALFRFFYRYQTLRKRLYFQGLTIIVISFLLTFLSIRIASKIFAEDNILEHPVSQIAITVGLLVLIIHLLLTLLSNLVKDWVESKTEIEALKKAKLLNDYNSLQDRLNPHFLFNNLSVLKSLIHYDSAAAEEFTQNFTDVYRYVLKSHEKRTISVKREIEFLKAYIALHKERVGEGLNVSVNIQDDVLEREIPPMTIQLLVENAVKHNVANKQSPLSIQIYSEHESITVKNNLNKKDTTYSTKTGLSTLKMQYRLISGQDIKVEESRTDFCVSVPLL